MLPSRLTDNKVPLFIVNDSMNFLRLRSAEIDYFSGFSIAASNSVTLLIFRRYQRRWMLHSRCEVIQGTTFAGQINKPKNSTPEWDYFREQVNSKRSGTDSGSKLRMSMLPVCRHLHLLSSNVRKFHFLSALYSRPKPERVQIRTQVR